MADRKTIKFGPEWLRNVANPASSGNGVDNNPSPEGNYHRGQTVHSNTNQRGGLISVAPKYQRAEFRYGREELLAIFDIDLEPPPMLQRFDSLFVTAAQLPFALSEKNYESDLADNGNAENLGRGAPPGDRFGQPKRVLSETNFRGRTTFGYTGRGRSSYDLNPSEARPVTTRAWSSSATTVQTTSAKSPVAEDWNARNQKNRWTETSNWRRKPQNPVTGKAFGEDSEGVGWRNTDPPQTRPVNHDKSRGDYAGRGGRYVPRRQWSGDLNNSDDHLPEWAVDSNVNTGGTFDSSGAFHGSSDDSVLNRPTGDGFHGLSRSQTQGSISLKKEAHPDDGPVEDWWDSEKARKLQPPKLPTVDFKYGKPIVPAFEEKPKPETVHEKISKHKINKTADINDMEHKKVEPVTQHKPSDIIHDEKQDETNENKTEITEKQDVILKQRNDQRVLPSETNLSVNLDKPSFLEPVDNKIKLDLENEHLRSFQAPSIRPVATPIFGAPLPPDADKWYYEDPQNQTQGPFTSAEMSQWWREGFFNSELRVRRGGDTRMHALRELGQVPPFVLEVLPPSTPLPIPQAYCFPPSRSVESNTGIFGVPPRDLPEPAFSPLQRVLPSYQPLPTEPLPHGNLNTDHLSNLYKFNNERHNFIEETMENLNRPMISSMSQERPNYVNSTIDHMTAIPFPARVPNIDIMTPQTAMAMSPDLGLAYPNLINPQTQTAVNNTYQSVSQSLANKPPPPEVDSLWGPMTNIRWSVPEPKSIPDNDLWNTAASSNTSTFLPNKNKVEEENRIPLKSNLEHIVPPALMSNPLQQLEKINIREALLPNVLEVSKLESKVHEEVKNCLLDISKSQSIQQSVEASKIVEQKPQIVTEPKLPVKTTKSEKKAAAKEAQQPKQMIVVEAEKQSKTKSKTKENATQPVQNQKKKKDEEKPIQEDSNRNTVQTTAPRPAPWSAKAANIAAPNYDKLTLDEIQRLEREKKAEQLKEQQQAVQILAQQHHAALAREQEMQFSWVKNKASGNASVPVKSLAVIQAEEAKRVAAQMPPPPPPVVTEPSTFVPWAAPTSKPVPISGFWDTLPTTKVGKPERSTKANPAPAKKQTKQPSAPQSKQSNNPKKNNNMEFDSWCIEALKSWSYQIDAPTFIGFLKDIESPFEVKDYVKCYLGESKDALDFSKQFIEKRSKLLRKSVVLSVDDLCSPAPALNNAANDFGDPKGKGKKTKKNKMQKVDARILGFSVTASEDRINVGDIDTV